MIEVPSLLKQRWRSGNLTGEAKHACLVRIRQGHMDHRYQTAERLNGVPIIPPLIWKGINHSPWQGQWVPTGPWIGLSNVESVNWQRSFQQKGASNATIVIDSVAFFGHEGAAGAYHEIIRGYYSPLRGIKVLSRPDLWGSESYENVLNGGYQIEVWEGYGQGDDIQLPDPDTGTEAGPAIMKTWVGLIQSCDLESNPDKITLTCRDFGVLLTDQRMMGWNKAREIRAPVTFADRKWAQGEIKEYGKPNASGGRVRTDSKHGVMWTSQGHSDKGDLTWIEIECPQGHYEDFFLAPEFDGAEMYVSINFKGPGHGHNFTPLPDGWVDAGNGNVPGTGIPWVRHMQSVSSWARRWALGERYQWSDGTRVRLWFTNLPKASGPQFKAPANRGVEINSFYIFRYGTDPSKPPGAKVNAKHWILVEDASDVIRMLLIWAGFKEFHVEDFGWSLAQPMQFGEDQFFMDVIDTVLKQGNFVFYMGRPSDDDMSIGVPTFEHQKATDAARHDIVEVRDTDLTESLQVVWDNSNLPYVMRYRGNVSKHGHTLDQDLSKRYQATYYPPWSQQHYFALGNPVGGRRYDSYAPHLDRVAGVRRHFTQTIGRGLSVGLDSDSECLFACLLAAVQFVLQMATGTMQMPGLPAFDLNAQVSLVEEATGVNSRMWVASIESDHSLGPDGKWEMKVGGSLIDVQDMYLIAADYLWAYKKLVIERPPGSEARPAPWPDPGAADIVALSQGRD